jgi:hypothetical protein
MPPIEYTFAVKTERMEVVKQALDDGRLLLGNATTWLASVQLKNPCGMVFAGLLHFTGDPFIAEAKESGTLSRAILVRSDGSLVAQGLTVGMAGTDILVDKVAVIKGNLIKIDSVDLRHA